MYDWNELDSYRSPSERAVMFEAILKHLDREIYLSFMVSLGTIAVAVLVLYLMYMLQ